MHFRDIKKYFFLFQLLGIMVCGSKNKTMSWLHMYCAFIPCHILLVFQRSFAKLPFMVDYQSYLVGILCFKFSLNPLRFSLTRETDSKLTRAKSWAIFKTSILEWKNWPRNNFAKLPSAKRLFLYKFTFYLQLPSFWL